jgi:hypothetical protein
MENVSVMHAFKIACGPTLESIEKAIRKGSHLIFDLEVESGKKMRILVDEIESCIKMNDGGEYDVRGICTLLDVVKTNFDGDNHAYIIKQSKCEFVAFYWPEKSRGTISITSRADS